MDELTSMCQSLEINYLQDGTKYLFLYLNKQFGDTLLQSMELFFILLHTSLDCDQILYLSVK